MLVHKVINSCKLQLSLNNNLLNIFIVKIPTLWYSIVRDIFADIAQW